MSEEKQEPEKTTVKPSIKVPESKAPHPYNPADTNADGQDIHGLDRGVVDKSLALKGLDASSLEYSPKNSLDDMLAGARLLIESNVLPSNYQEPEQVVGAIKMGHEYGLPALIALNNIHMIEGKPTLNVHLIGALLLRGGWTYNVEAHPCPENNYMAAIRFTNKRAEAEHRAKLKEVNGYHEDVRKRMMDSLDNIAKAISQVFTFSYAEAEQMGLTKKGNWVKMPYIMLRSRCLTLGARLFAPDLMMGMNETAEWADVKNIDVSYREEDASVVLD